MRTGFQRQPVAPSAFLLTGVIGDCLCQIQLLNARAKAPCDNRSDLKKVAQHWCYLRADVLASRNVSLWQSAVDLLETRLYLWSHYMLQQSNPNWKYIETSRENGALQVVPGSHLLGRQVTLWQPHSCLLELFSSHYNVQLLWRSWTQVHGRAGDLAGVPASTMQQVAKISKTSSVPLPVLI